MRARASVRVSSFTRVRTFALCDFSSLNHDTKEQPQKLTKAYSPPPSTSRIPAGKITRKAIRPRNYWAVFVLNLANKSHLAISGSCNGPGQWQGLALTPVPSLHNVNNLLIN